MPDNFGRAGGYLNSPAPAEQPPTKHPRDYTALEERAVLAFLDRRDDEQNAVLRAAREAVYEVLETEEFEVEELQGNDKAIVLVDGMKFRVTTGTRSPSTSMDKVSNATIEGIHDVDYWTLAVFLGATWHSIASLADLGALVK